MVCGGSLAVYAFAAVGALVVAWFGLVYLHFLYRIFLRAPKKLTQYGSWAVVTGSTDGIGKAYAKELARKGLNILLISRSVEKLKETQSEIETATNNKVSVKTLAVDFSTADKATYQRIQNELKSIDLGILVNNVGVSYEYCEFFHDVSDQVIDNLLKINIEATTYMTKLALPLFLAKGKGAILNISSMSGVIPAPLLSAYGASKAYVDNFSRMLAIEYKGKGIFIQSVTPAFVISKMSGFRRPTLTIPTADKFVRSAVRTIGYEVSVAGFWVHDVIRTIVRMLPESLVGPNVLKSHLALRKRYLEKRKNK